MVFKARRLVKGFGRAPTDAKETSSPKDSNVTLGLSVVPVKKAQKAFNMNNLSASRATMEHVTEVLMIKAHKARIVEHYGGLAHLIASLIERELMEEYRPKDQISKSKEKRKLMNIKLNPGKNTKKIFERISKIENECSGNARSSNKESLLVITMISATTVCAPGATMETRLKRGASEISNLKSAMA